MISKPTIPDTERISADSRSENSTHYASLFVIDVLNSVKRLENFPRSGRIVPESNDPIIREIILKNPPVNLYPCWKGKAVFPMTGKFNLGFSDRKRLY